MQKLNNGKKNDKNITFVSAFLKLLVFLIYPFLYFDFKDLKLIGFLCLLTYRL